MPALGGDQPDRRQPVKDILHRQSGQNDGGDPRKYHGDLLVPPAFGKNGQAEDGACRDHHRQQRKREALTGDDGSVEPDNVAIYPLAIPLLAGPSAIMSVIVVNASFAGALTSTIIGYASLIAVMVATGLILCMTVIAESWLNERVTMVFSRITAIILAGLSVQYVIDGIQSVGLVP